MEQLPIEYPVGLTREEYLRSQRLLTRGTGAFRVLSLVMAVFFLLMLVVDVIETRQIDLPLAVIVAAVAGAALTLSFSAPRVFNKRHGETYDQTLFGGYCFDGVVKVSETQISKVTPSGETVIPFGNCFYLEAEDTMIFRNQHGKSIVIPARCLTEADAEATRAAAMNGVPSPNRRLTARLKATRQERLPMPSLEKPLPEDPLLTVAVEYTEKEFKGMMTEAAVEAIPAALPMKILFAAGVAGMAFEVSSFAMLATFLVLAVVFSLFPVVTARSKARRAIDVTDGSVLTLTVALTPSTVRMQGTGEHGKTLEIPWSRITRAVELPQQVELYTDKKLVQIPKRCIADMDELRRTVDERMSEA